MKSALLNQPELPYNGTSGHSGTDTSRERALHADRSGKTALRQAQALNLLAQRKLLGMTWKELSEITGLHHGTASGVLSVLHKAGRIARLKETRKGCKVYVDVACIQGRVVERQGRKKNCPHCGGDL
jgi:DNA-binding MarR family transcriptional regulator